MNLEELAKRVENGESFRVDFKNRTLKVGKDIFNEKNVETTDFPLMPPEEFLKVVEGWYRDYKYSVPTERSEKGQRKYYFKALRSSEMTDEQLCCGCEREVARARLEGGVLFGIINGDMYWKDEFGKWFWQSKEDKDLVILREWVE